jgi:hypothetical protein
MLTFFYLQGEVMAHILNGVINKPARDAMLLHHAIMDLAPSPGDAPPHTKSSRRDSSSSAGSFRSDSRPSKDPTPRSSGAKIRNPFSTSDRKVDNKKDPAAVKDRKYRYELLISRLVRLHWDRAHLRKVKDGYREKYGVYVEDDLEDCVKQGEFMEFCLALLEGR